MKSKACGMIAQCATCLFVYGQDIVKFGQQELGILFPDHIFLLQIIFATLSLHYLL